MKKIKAILLIVFLIINAESNMTKVQSEYWYYMDGKKIELEQVGNTWFIEFKEGLLPEEKETVLRNLDLKIVKKIQLESGEKSFDFNNEVVPVEINDNNIITDIQKYIESDKDHRLLGILPTLKQKRNDKILYYRPGTIGIAFKLNYEVKQKEIDEFIQQKKLNLRTQKESIGFTSYYILRMVEVDLPEGKLLFDFIREISEAEEIRFAYPLLIGGHARIKQKIGYYNGKLWDNEPKEMGSKMNTPLRELYRMYNTLEPQIFDKYISTSGIKENLKDDMVRVSVTLNVPSNEVIDDLGDLDFVEDKPYDGSDPYISGYTPIKYLLKLAEKHYVKRVESFSKYPEFNYFPLRNQLLKGEL